jgi:hypothetical protein
MFCLAAYSLGRSFQDGHWLMGKNSSEIVQIQYE